jgi:hypothetical protein
MTEAIWLKTCPFTRGLAVAPTRGMTKVANATARLLDASFACLQSLHLELQPSDTNGWAKVQSSILVGRSGDLIASAAYITNYPKLPVGGAIAQEDATSRSHTQPGGIIAPYKALGPFD